jgi:hypothetical protein
MDVDPYKFEAIEDYYKDGSFENTGGDDSVDISGGKLSELINMVGVFKVKTSPIGNRTS